MVSPRRLGLAAPAALAATLIFIDIAATYAKAPADTKPEPSALGAALAITRTEGAATVAVITSVSQPQSVRLWQEFNHGTWSRDNRGLVQLVNVSTETEPGLIRTMGVVQFPTVLVFVRGNNGVTRLARITGLDSAETLVNRLRSLGLGSDTLSKVDPDIKRTSHGGDIYASQQVPPPPPSWPQIQTAPPVQSPPQAPPVSFAPTAVPTVTTSAGLVQMPGQNLVVQQAPMQVYLAPAQSPVVYVPQQAATAAPLAAPVSVAQPAIAAAPTGNVFMMAPNVSAAPVAQPTVALAAPTSPAVAAAAPSATVAVAAAAPSVAAVSNQTLSLPSSGARTRVRVRGPGLLGSSLARLGERLTQLGRARIETVQETTLEAPVSRAPGAGLTTISTTSAAPVAAPPTTVTIPVQQQPEVCKPPCAAPPCQNRPTGPTPSAQGDASR